MSKHTPGPWMLEASIGTNDSDCGWSVVPVIADYSYRGEICHVSDAEHINGITKEERDANARLIAAAPDILEALKECAERLGIHIKHTEDLMAHMKAHNAIQKATGEQP